MCCLSPVLIAWLLKQQEENCAKSVQPKLLRNGCGSYFSNMTSPGMDGIYDSDVRNFYLHRENMGKKSGNLPMFCCHGIQLPI